MEGREGKLLSCSSPELARHLPRELLYDVFLCRFPMPRLNTSNSGSCFFPSRFHNPQAMFGSQLMSPEQAPLRRIPRKRSERGQRRAAWTLDDLSEVSGRPRRPRFSPIIRRPPASER